IAASGIPADRHVCVSGIGCTGRIAGYVKIDSYHTTHGRPVAFATGMHIANPDLEVTVFSGDGDLATIGGNHLIHAIRRNVDINIFCVNNFAYGMTGGQKSPTTGLDVRTLTSPEGNEDRPVEAQALVKAHGNFYAKTTTYHLGHLKRSVKAGLKHRGFSFIDVKCQCIVNNGRRLGFKNGYEMLRHLKESYKIKGDAEWLRPGEIGVTR
ncbi:MAG: thiamine pyrophosphate-dependent enzyme, partial [Candidatus Bathyarchaeia archaeon]